MSSDVVDLYTLRCAVATVVHARHHLDELQPDQLARLNRAIGHLSSVSEGLHGEVAAATRALLSDAPDPGGRRTVRSIDRLAQLTHVDPLTAPALASRLRSAV